MAEGSEGTFHGPSHHAKLAVLQALKTLPGLSHLGALIRQSSDTIDCAIVRGADVVFACVELMVAATDRACSRLAADHRQAGRFVFARDLDEVAVVDVCWWSRSPDAFQASNS